MTRALIEIRDEDDVHLCTIYTHADGMPSHLGARLKAILDQRTQACGIPVPAPRPYDLFNGASELPIILISQLKARQGRDYPTPYAPGELVPGGFYLWPPEYNEHADVDYIYIIRALGVGQEVWISVSGYGEEIFSGPISTFLP